ncbi:hypothetical protein A4X13_0g7937 [Tilletia indica]|uniref:Uncharacterized protein n=1 Tax=Tilletia indica TaxID=43049 RepID=A0A177TUZ7_9BASI|nr:hypothetical protein A4X13_0g7937 [Tilletia indica]
MAGSSSSPLSFADALDAGQKQRQIESSFAEATRHLRGESRLKDDRGFQHALQPKKRNVRSSKVSARNFRQPVPSFPAPQPHPLGQEPSTLPGAWPSSSHYDFNMDDFGDDFQNQDDGQLFGENDVDDPYPDFIAAFDISKSILEPPMLPVDEYLELLFKLRVAQCTRVDQRCWVVEGMREGLPETGKFYHLILHEGSAQTSATCDCPTGRNVQPCIHKDAILKDPAAFKGQQAISSYSNPAAIEIAASLHGRHSWISVLSSQSMTGAQLIRHDQKRTIVSLVGPDSWSCSAYGCSGHSKPAATCIHRSRAKAFLEHVLGRDVNEVEDCADDELAAIDDSPVTAQAHYQQRACSFQPRPPPRYCRLPSELDTEPSPPTLDALPAVLPFDGVGRCSCGATYSSAAPTFARSCIIYHTRGVIKKEIEVQRCGCKRRGETRTIGPDLNSYDLFNWSVDLVFSHELLNSYTSQLAASPTPLSAFHTTITDAYSENRCQQAFVARSTFMKVYFAFIELQQAQVEFSCPTCGPTPSAIIADGVVLAHSAKLQHSRLNPPTNPSGPANTNAMPGKVLPFLPVAALRDSLQQLANNLLPPSNPSRSIFLDTFCQHINAARTLPNVEATRSTWMKVLQQFVRAVCRDFAPQNGEVLIAVRHVLREFAAGEGVWQMCRPVCVPWLRSFTNKSLQFPSTESSKTATTIAAHSPSLGLLIRSLNDCAAQEPESYKTLVAALLPLLSSVADMVEHQKIMFGLVVSSDTEQQVSAALDSTSSLASSPFPTSNVPYAQSGQFYGAPQCRERPLYTRFGEKRSTTGYSRDGDDAQQLLSVEGVGTCKKYFNDYVTQRRTGGIMALWCRHLVCVGFHVIPRCEGRNDVFSAVFTHWQHPPDVIIYDFACQLAPYCLAREPSFFKNVLFVVDQMHQHGHSTCTSSSYLSSYMSTDPQLQHINSSAAECGNAGLSRIRKSVSYCNQEHAVLLIKQFLSIWNRRRMLRMVSGRKGNARQ